MNKVIKVIKGLLVETANVVNASGKTWTIENFEQVINCFKKRTMFNGLKTAINLDDFLSSNFSINIEEVYFYVIDVYINGDKLLMDVKIINEDIEINKNTKLFICSLSDVKEEHNKTLIDLKEVIYVYLSPILNTKQIKDSDESVYCYKDLK